MAGTGTNKPIVFVFGAKKGDVESRKKNLSAINTQVAYRAHERRREKKNRQRAQAKEDGKVEQKTSSVAVPDLSEAPSSSSSSSLATDQHANDLNFHYFHSQGATPPTGARRSGASQGQKHPHAPPKPTTTPYFVPERVELCITKPSHPRHSSDNSSDVSSDNDAVWSLSPASNRQSTPSTELSSYSPPAYSSGMTNGYFEKGLDPFFRLPTVATDRERWLVHFCKLFLIIRTMSNNIRLS